MSHSEGLTDEELICFLEIANVAIQTMREKMAEELDISDEEMSRLADRLKSYMEDGEHSE